MNTKEQFQIKNARRKALKAKLEPREWRQERAFRRGTIPKFQGDKAFWAINGAFGRLKTIN